MGVGSGSDLAATLDALEFLSKEEIVERFVSLYEREPPPRMRWEVLLRAVAHRLQENAQGGPDPTFHRRLAKLAEALRRTGSIPVEANPPSIKPGSRLLRTWNSETHSVTVSAMGYVYRGETYRSLSKIARLITGTRWSGPAFFGLVKTTRGPRVDSCAEGAQEPTGLACVGARLVTGAAP